MKGRPGGGILVAMERRVEATPGPGWAACPGCGVSLPGPGEPGDPRRNASGACWRLYGEVAGFELANLAILGRHHQLMVDTYGAQHAGPAVPAIGPAFSLIGLRMALDEGASGLEVRAAHQFLAQQFREWPVFERPPRVAGLTVFDVGLAASPAEHERILLEWANDVWAEWRSVHAEIAALVRERLPDHVRRGLGSGG